MITAEDIKRLGCLAIEQMKREYEERKENYDTKYDTKEEKRCVRHPKHQK